MRKRTRTGFTMIELMIAAVVLLILSSVAVAGYQGYRDRAAMLVDETNQKVLAAAFKLYAYDNNATPGSLSQLQPQHLERAFALVTGGKRHYTVFAYLKEWMGAGVAEAETLPPKYYNNNPRVLACPMDKTPPSYVIVPAWSGRPLSEFLAADGSQRLIEEDRSRPRHAGGSTIVFTTINGNHGREKIKHKDKDKDKDKGK